MIKGLIGLHASFTLSDETLNKCIKLNKNNSGYHIHVSEGLIDEKKCFEKYGMSIVKRLKKHNILGSNTIAAHCIHINDEDMEILKNTNTIVAHNPESNMSNAVGCADVLKMIDKGILVGLGTDGYTNDMFESMKVCNLLQKHNSKNPSVAFNEAINMLFKNNREIAQRFFTGKIGVLEKDALADVIVVDYRGYTPIDNNINSHLMFGVIGKNVVTTIVNGKILMQDRKLLNIDEEKVIYECNKSCKKLWNRIN